MGGTFCLPPGSIVDTNLNSSIDGWCYIVRMTLNRRSNLKQSLRSPARQLMSSKDQTCNNTSYNRSAGTSKTTSIGDTTNHMILENGNRFVGSLEGGFQSNAHEVRLVLWHFFGTFSLCGYFKFTRTCYSYLGPQIYCHSNAVISWTHICRCCRNTNCHTIPRCFVLLFHRNSLSDPPPHLFFMVVREENITFHSWITLGKYHRAGTSHPWHVCGWFILFTCLDCCVCQGCSN
mmetsp:Transcript_16838/g.31891  ORF Transcript_16838/g.31891 Transcript_16838/m.31891 type:complete len:233 (-) Transcript_16838:344-1042(-)